MSALVSAKQRLVGSAGVLAPLLTGVTVAYSMPVKDIPRELVYGGSVVGPVELSAFAGGSRVKRKEELTLLIHVRVYKPNKTAEEIEARLVEIADVITLYIAANWTLGDLAELKLAKVAGYELGEPWTDDDGSGSTLTIAVELTSYLT